MEWSELKLRSESRVPYFVDGGWRVGRMFTKSIGLTDTEQVLVSGARPFSSYTWVRKFGVWVSKTVIQYRERLRCSWFPVHSVDRGTLSQVVAPSWWGDGYLLSSSSAVVSTVSLYLWHGPWNVRTLHPIQRGELCLLYSRVFYHSEDGRTESSQVGSSQKVRVRGREPVYRNRGSISREGYTRKSRVESKIEGFLEKELIRSGEDLRTT